MARKVKLPKKFYPVRSGEWLQPTPKNYLMKCCDCGLVHSLDFRIHADRIQFRAYRVK